MKNYRHLGTWLLICLLMTIGTLGAQNFQLKRSLISSGGPSSGGGYELNSSMGQVITEQSVGAEYELHAGYWQLNNDLIFKNKFE